MTLALSAILASTTSAFESIVRPKILVMDEAIERFGEGYDWVNHEVHTEDGYILNMFRLVPPGVKDTKSYHKWGDPVFMMHGMGANGARWLL